MKTPRSTFSLPGFLIFCVLAGVTGAYFVFHKPVDGALFAVLLAAAFRTLTAVLILAAAALLGRRLLPGLPLNPGARLFVASAIGTGFLSVAYFLAGSLVGISTWAGWLSLPAIFTLLRRDLRPLWADFRRAAADAFLAARTHKGIAALAALGLLFAWMRAAAPPVKFDALVYHLALPAEYLARGRIAYAAGNAFWGMPQLVEGLFTWIVSLTGAFESAAVLGWCAGVLALLGLLSYANQRLGSDAAWIAAAAVLAGASSLDSLGWAYVDWFSFFFGLAALILVDLALSDRAGAGARWAAAAGLAAGFAFGTKYSAGAVAAAGFAALAVFSTAADGRVRLRQTGLFAAAAGLAAAPWLLKNLLATGNPLYPFLFASGEMTALRLELYAGLAPWGGWENAFFLPLLASLVGHEGGAGYGASVGPLLLAFGLFAGAGARSRLKPQRDWLRRTAFFALTGLLIWALAGRASHYLIQSRLYFGFFPAFALLAAAGYQNISQFEWPGVRLGRIAGLLVLLVLGLNVLQAARESFSRGAPQTLLALQSAESYRMENLGMHLLAISAADALPAGARVLMLFEPRALGCLHCDPDEFLDRWAADSADFSHDVERITASWRVLGFTHVLLNRFGAEFQSVMPQYNPADWPALERLEATLPAPVVDLNGVYLLYEIP